MGGWLKGRLRHGRRFLKRWGAQEGFTLIELMVVVAILAVLGLLAVPKLWGAVQTTTRQVAVEQAHQIRSAMEMYRSENKEYPSDGKSLDTLSELASVLDPWVEIVADGSSNQIYASTLLYDRTSNKKSYTLTLFIPAKEDPGSSKPEDWLKIEVKPDGVIGPSTMTSFPTGVRSVRW